MLRPSDLPIAVRALLSVLEARWVLRSGFDHAVRRYALAPATSGGTSRTPTARDRRAATVAMRVVRLTPLGATCLPRAIAIGRVLARRGVDPMLVLGVSKAAGFTAHAWVEVGAERFDPAHYPPGAYDTTGRFVFTTPSPSERG